MKKSKAAIVAAVVALFATTAQATAWKMAPLSSQVSMIQKAQELQETQRQDFLCMAFTIYHEARGESFLMQKAVGHVVLNRVKSGRFKPTICGVVWQPGQFTWTSRPVGSIVPREKNAWVRAQDAAYIVMQDTEIDPTGGALFFGRLPRIVVKG